MPQKASGVDKITAQNTLEEVLQIPGAEDVMIKYGFPCLSCPLGGMEMPVLTLEQVAETYGIDLEGFLVNINDFIKQQKKSTSKEKDD